MPAPLPPYLTEAALDAFVDLALAEDVGPGDVTTQATIPAGTQARATFLAKASGVVAGLTAAGRVFGRVDSDLRVAWSVDDGAMVVVPVRVSEHAGRR